MDRFWRTEGYARRDRRRAQQGGQRGDRRSERQRASGGSRRSGDVAKFAGRIREIHRRRYREVDQSGEVRGPQAGMSTIGRPPGMIGEKHMTLARRTFLQLTAGAAAAAAYPEFASA